MRISSNRVLRLMTVAFVLVSAGAGNAYAALANGHLQIGQDFREDCVAVGRRAFSFLASRSSNLLRRPRAHCYIKSASCAFASDARWDAAPPMLPCRVRQGRSNP